MPAAGGGDGGGAQGIVREEFFAAGTPLVCSTAGGLKERVHAYERSTRCGQGVLYSSHTHGSLLGALEQAVALFASGEHYAALRSNAYEQACDIADTAWHWRCELQRLRACLAARQAQDADGIVPV